MNPESAENFVELNLGWSAGDWLHWASAAGNQTLGAVDDAVMNLHTNVFNPPLRICPPLKIRDQTTIRSEALAKIQRVLRSVITDRFKKYSAPCGYVLAPREAEKPLCFASSDEFVAISAEHSREPKGSSV